MNILLIIQNSKIPVTNYGGIERVVWYLAKELHDMRHHVYMLAAKGSTCPYAEVIEYNPALSFAQQIPKEIDIIHCQNGVDESIVHLPHVVTAHCNYMKGKLDRNTIFVSRNHASRYGSDSFVYNGMDWDDYGEVDLHTPRHYYHFLGKAAWRVKNVRGAISTIKAMPHEHLRVLGGYRFNFKMGLRFTFSPKISFDCMVGGSKKLRLLNGSKGLIFPVLWDEPFGIAITESLYMGAPVFGTPYGSLPELVSPEVGFLTTNQGELVSHLLHHYHYSPKTCHEYAADEFGSKLMAKRYLEKYEQVLNGHPLNEKAPEEIMVNQTYTWNK